VVIATAVLFLGVAIASLMQVFGYGRLPIYSSLYADLPLLIMVLVSIRYGLRHIEDRSERYFWNLLSLGFCVWLAQVVLVLVTQSKTFRPVEVGFTSSLLFFLFYVSLMLGLESQPHLAVASTPGLLRLLDRLGVLAFFIGVLLYCEITPLLIESDSIQASSWMVYVVFDLYLSLRLIGFIRVARERHWQRIYGWLLIAVLLWFVSDILGLAIVIGIIGDQEPYGMFDPFFIFSLVSVVIAARSRELSRLERATELRIEPLYALHMGPLIFYAMMFPLIHIGFTKSVLYSPSLATVRETLVLTFLILRTSLALRYP
jgi:hypothetical protein